MTKPSLGPILENLQQSRPNIMFRIQPRQRRIRLKWRMPLKAPIRQQLHLKQWIRQTGEIIIVNPRIDKRRGQFQLAHIILHGKLRRPQGNRRPRPMHRVIRHTAIDVMLDGTGALSGVCERAADGDLVAGLGGGVDEGEGGALKKGVYKGGIVEQWALEEGDVGEALEFLGDDAFEGVDLGANLVADSRGDADERRSLAAGGIDDGDSFHAVVGGGEGRGGGETNEGTARAAGARKDPRRDPMGDPMGRAKAAIRPTE